MQTIRVEDLAEHCREGNVDLIDVRTPAEFESVHATMARNVPLDSLDPDAVMANHPKDQPLYVICQSGNRSCKAVEQFLKAGYQNVYSVEGGTAAWEQAGLPVVRGRQVISLERQVRIVAGTIVLVSSLLAISVNPWFAAIAAFIGAGLAYSGITDTCGMAMILAKMPWNQRSGCQTASQASCTALPEAQHASRSPRSERSPSHASSHEEFADSQASNAR